MAKKEPSKKLLNHCKTTLEKYIKDEISFQPKEQFYSISCKNPESVSDGRNQYIVAKLNDLEHFWINFALKFDIQQEKIKHYSYILTDANLKVFYINDQIRPLLFRAEFATNESDKNHAQPHWQFEPYIYKGFDENDFSTAVEINKEAFDLTDSSHLSPLNISKIHFSMTSNWHRSTQNRDNHIIGINEKNVIDWLDGCLGYIVEQLKLCI